MKTKTDSIGLVLVFAGLTVLTGCKEEPDAITLPRLAELETTEITVNSATVKGVVLAQGGTLVTARGFCWSTAPDPTIDDLKLTEGKGIGHFTGRITGLLPGTEYHVRAFATNMDGTSYSISELIRTPLTVTQATLETLAPENITSTSVSSGGEITDIGGGEILERGICWSTEPSPTIAHSKAIAGAGSGRFTIKVNNLEPGSTYYVRAYAINSAGVSYGPEMNFSTPPGLGIKSVSYPGETKFYSTSFSIENKIYMGLGSADGWDYWPTGDFWEWNQATNQWTSLAIFPGTINSPVGFSIGGKGYIFTNSWTEENRLTNELWEYDPALDRWTRKSSLPAEGSRFYPVAFSIGSRGYIGLGSGMDGSGNNAVYRNDLWEWDPATDVWTRKADFPGPGRYGAAAFVIGDRGYIGTGNTSVDVVNDFWEYDQSSDEWTRKADFAGVPRVSAIGFSAGNKGYLGPSQYSTLDGVSQGLWEWDPVMDKWSLFAEVPESVTIQSGGASGNNGYFIIDPLPENWQVQLWIFPLTTEK